LPGGFDEHLVFGKAKRISDQPHAVGFGLARAWRPSPTCLNTVGAEAITVTDGEDDLPPNGNDQCLAKNDQSA
jgi:hypothetical protein